VSEAICQKCDGAGELVRFGALPTKDGDFQRVPCPECRAGPTDVDEDKPIRIQCDDCGWKSDPSKDSSTAIEAAQDHEDTEHEGSKVEWLRVN